MFDFNCQTVEGPFRIRFSEIGLSRVSFPPFGDVSTRSPASQAEGQSSLVPMEWLNLTRSAIQDGLLGRPLGKLPPLDLQGTDFQRLVWQVLQSIPCGETRTYGQVAIEVGKPGGMRAVGGACGANPIPVIVPCHRVLAAGGKLGGFSGGTGWKPFLLAREGWGGGADLPLFQHRNESDSAQIHDRPGNLL